MTEQRSDLAEARRSPPWLGDTEIRFAVVAALIIGCFRIAEPFTVILIWAVLLSLPILAWVWSTSGMTPALLFGGWIIVVQVFDAAIKPFMLGRGLQIPVPIILIGVIGGALAAGLLGLFVGPVLLSIAYILLLEWLGEPLPAVPANEASKRRIGNRGEYEA